MYSVMLTVSVTLTLRLRGLRSVLPHLGQGTQFSDGTSSESPRNIPHARHWTMSSLSFAILLPSGSLQHEEEYQLNWGGEPILVSDTTEDGGREELSFFQDKERIGILASLSFRRAAPHAIWNEGQGNEHGGQGRRKGVLGGHRTITRCEPTDTGCGTIGTVGAVSGSPTGRAETLRETIELVLSSD